MNREQIIQMARPKSIPSAPGYFIDRDGEVYNHRGRRLAQQVTAKGYCRVHLQINGETKSKSVHSLVAEVFIGPKPKGLQIRHLDGNKCNNKPNNLAYGTAKENEDDKISHGTKAVGNRNGMHTKPEARARGSSHGRTSLRDDEVRQIKESLLENTRGIAAALAKKFGVSPTTISNIKSGTTWGHV
jgi:hypothetical protein